MSPSISAEACAQRIADAKQLDDTALGIKRSHGGRIKTRLANKSNTVLWITLGVLVAVTIFTFIIMDYGKIPMAQAVPAAFEDFFTMLTQPTVPIITSSMEDVIIGTVESLALAALTTFIGAVIAFFFGLFAAMNLSNKAISNVIKAIMSFFRAVPTILWVLIFTVAIGLGPEAAVTGLLFHSVA